MSESGGRLSWPVPANFAVSGSNETRDCLDGSAVLVSSKDVRYDGAGGASFTELVELTRSLRDGGGSLPLPLPLSLPLEKMTLGAELLVMLPCLNRAGGSTLRRFAKSLA